ncbi:MAG: copper oxidase [Candidatus Eremiobacter antarcticus]|nr:copper oxidase [Candidatus Eremiobacteraeota bacterium]MBC5808741.1 copper oxidase [Candidatus Eremiobacteraeota bacterium]PZR62214.1 MAG: copper oxidase [Candidatus Eremiobacter sp. RRmetagenome_bin22]
MNSVKPRASVPEIVAVTLLSLLMLIAGVLIAANYGNFAMRGQPGTAKMLSSEAMPRGMIMSADQNTEQMKGMAAVDPAQVGYTASADARGDRLLQPQVVNGVKVFHLTTSVITWHILKNRTVAAYAYNNQVPGPMIRIRQGDHIKVIVTNDLPEATSVHWHGLIVPNNMDGPPPLTQKAIAPGSSFAYEFTPMQAGTFFYHSHVNADRQEALGLYGAFIIDPIKKSLKYDKEVDIQLGEWTVRGGRSYPAMPMEGLLPNFFTINGKAYPETEPIHLRVGQRLLVRFIGTSSGFEHPMHIHGGPFKIIATDGNPVPDSARLLKDTVLVAPGERYDVIWRARSKGKWLIHCHINHHTTNDGEEVNGAGGLTEVIDVD